jgi:hypothetical protein
MAIGDIKFSELKVGGIDLNDPNQAYPHEINIHEDITNSYGPACEIRAVDPSDAIGKNNINGGYDQEIKIRFSDDKGGQVGFTFKPLENSNLLDEAQSRQGSLHAKTYTIKGVPAEMLNAQGNYVEKSYEDKTTNIAKDIIQNNYKTDKQIEIDDEAREKRRWIASNEHPLTVLQKLNDEHVATQSKSSAYTIFQQQENGTSKYKVTTYEKLFQQAPVATVKQVTTLDSAGMSDQDRQNSIMWINVGENHFSGSRQLENSAENTVNLTTHKVVATEPKESSFTFPGKPVYKGKPQNRKEVPQSKLYDKKNEPNEQRITPGDAKVKRAQFLSHLAQNSAELEIPGNPSIKLGSMIDLQMPNRVDATLETTNESQFGGKVLVVGIRHRIKPPGQTPRYTQVLKVVKASFDKNGGGTA